MANTNIEDICNNPELGDNVVKTVVAGEASMKPGMAVYYYNSTGVKMLVPTKAAQFAGVLGTKYDHTNSDTVYSNGEQSIPLITEGYVGVRIDDPGAAKYEGQKFWTSGGSAGNLGLTAYDSSPIEENTGDFITGVTDVYPVAGTLIENISNGDQVAKMRIDK